MKKIIILLFFSVLSDSIHCQHIQLDFPALPEKSIKVFYFKASEQDSLTLTLDISGKGTTMLPAGYKGMLRIIADSAGVLECIGGEPVLQIRCDSNQLKRGNVYCPESKENEFLYNIFDEKSLLIQHLAWINAGFRLFGTNYEKIKKVKSPDNAAIDFITVLSKEKENILSQQDTLESKIKTSDLYAARFIELAVFTDDLFTAENRLDTAKIHYVKDYIHHKMNWQALYTSGLFWDVVHNYYISLFNKEFPFMDGKEKQKLYAYDINNLLSTLQEPIRSSILQSVISECARFGWTDARDSILNKISYE